MVAEWVLLAVTTVLLGGMAGIISKVALTKTPSSVLVISSFLVIMPVSLSFLIYYLIATGLAAVRIEYVMLGLASALFANLGFFLYFDALEKGPLMMIGSITSTYPAFIVIAAIAFLGELLTLAQAIGAATVIAGVVTLLYIHGTATGKSKIPRVALMLSILTIFSWTMWGILLKVALDNLDVILYLGLSAFVMPPITFAYLKLRNKGQRIQLPQLSFGVMLAIVSIGFEQLGFFSETFAVNAGPASLVFPVVASYPIVTIILAYAFLKERLSLKETLLILAVVAGIILVATI